MKFLYKKKIYVTLMIAALLMLTACGTSSSKDEKKSDEGKLSIVVTNSILEDMVNQVGGKHVDVHSLVPIAQDPHEHEPLPADTAKTSKAELIFYNGLNLETGNGWFTKLLDSTQQKDKEDKVTFAVSKGIDPIHLESKGQENEQDPHAWLSIQNGIKYIQNIEKTLSEKDPDNRADYEKNAAAYISKLEVVDKKAKKQMSDIPKDKAILITSEGAFKYFTQAYGLRAEYIWEINSENEGTPDQLTRIVDLAKDLKLPSLFVETSVNDKSMKTLSQETGVPIHEGKLFTDSLANKGEPGDTYLSMMEWNIKQIHDGLSK